MIPKPSLVIFSCSRITINRTVVRCGSIGGDELLKPWVKPETFLTVSRRLGTSQLRTILSSSGRDRQKRTQALMQPYLPNPPLWLTSERPRSTSNPRNHKIAACDAPCITDMMQLREYRIRLHFHFLLDSASLDKSLSRPQLN